MKIITSEQAVGLLHDGDTVAIGGFGAYCCPDGLLDGLAKAYLKNGHPSDLTVVTGIGCGNNTMDPIGLNRLGEDGLIGTLIAAHLANCPKIGHMVGDDLFPAYVIPLGVMAHMMRAIAGKKPGVVTQIGLGTFADPLEEACCANDKARKQDRTVVERIEIGGQTQLFYPAFPIQACLIRATWADEEGNISFAHEALTGMELEMAQAVHNCGGTVIVQVERVVKRSTLSAREVRIHKSLVDYVVIAEPGFHQQSYASAYRPELTGELICPESTIEPLPLNIRKIIARRGVKELRPGMVINLGIGIPSCVGSVAHEEGIRDMMLSLESGPIGGVPVAGLGFAAAVNAESIASIAETFDFYDGGGLDMTCLGAAEIDAKGNVNVSCFDGRCTGPGGFINISQTTPRVCFMLAFTAGKSDIVVEDGELHVKKDGENVKFVQRVQQITFSADYARQTGQQVLYITERAVFRLCDRGLELTEVAPGIDVQRDILDLMDFIPEISPDLKTMDPQMFYQ